jgi:hypothetical protein
MTQYQITLRSQVDSQIRLTLCINAPYRSTPTEHDACARVLAIATIDHAQFAPWEIIRSTATVV